MPQHTRSCLLVSYCARTGYRIVTNGGTAEHPNYVNLVELERGEEGGGKMFDFINSARGPDVMSPPRTPPSPPGLPPSAIMSSNLPGFEGGYVYLDPPGTDKGTEVHWVVNSKLSETGTDEAPMTRRLSDDQGADNALNMSKTIKYRISSPEPAGFISIGWSSDGSMIGSDAVICLASGAGSVGMYKLVSKSDAAENANSEYSNVLSEAFVVVEDGQIACEFTRPLLVENAVPFGLSSSTIQISSKGTQDQISYHDLYSTSFSVFLDGRGAGDGVPVSELQRRQQIHGVLMLVSWGFLLPAGAVIAKFYQNRDPWWFRLHLVCQIGGISLALASFILALGWFGPIYDVAITTDESRTHGTVGIVAMSLGLAQPVNGLLRPKHGHKFRFGWEVLHKGSGWIALFVAAAAVVLGINNYDYDGGGGGGGGGRGRRRRGRFPDSKTDFFVAYIVASVVVVLIGVAGLIQNRKGVVKEQAAKPTGTLRPSEGLDHGPLDGKRTQHVGQGGFVPLKRNDTDRTDQTEQTEPETPPGTHVVTVSGTVAEPTSSAFAA